jgi:hypothetical protein
MQIDDTRHPPITRNSYCIRVQSRISTVSVSTGLDWLCLILHSSVLTMERTSETCHLVHKVTGAGSTYDLMNLWQVQCPPWQLQGNTIPALFVKSTAPAQ